MARSADALEDVAQRCRSFGVSVATECVDFSDPAAIAPAIARLQQQEGTPAVVINNAGAALTASLSEVSLEQWQWLMQLNVTSVFQVCQAVLPGLRAQGGGLIVNISSHAARARGSGQLRTGAGPAGRIACEHRDARVSAGRGR